MVERPPLVAAAHGTHDPAGRAAIDALRAAVGEAAGGVRVIEAYVDEEVQHPGLSEVLATLPEAVVVPVLLSSGYHVHVDVTGAVAGARGTIRAAAALGPDPALADVLVERLAEAGAADDDTNYTVVLAAAGSSDPRAVTDVERMASLLADRLSRPVTAAYATANTPRIPDAVTTVQAGGNRVALASYVLAPGHFYDRIAAAGADLATAPLLPHPVIADLVVRRYEDALTAG
jgi:sirohydrochlorin ferrochelatase